ncbi:hypothetical protein P3T27_005159 [Kitasatospora sp. MAA19]|nr:hypothetical protein [Kitasatospora sp. MAA19]
MTPLLGVAGATATRRAAGQLGDREAPEAGHGVPYGHQGHG